MRLRLESNSHVPHSKIERFENDIGRKLPHDYVAFLSTLNGGKPEPNVYVGDDGRHLYSLCRLYGLTERAVDDLKIRHRHFCDRVPVGVLPVGEDDCGNLFCLLLTETDHGSVYFWDHEREAEAGEVADFRNMTKLASTFSLFFGRFVPNVPTVSESGVTEAWIDPEFARMIADRKAQSRRQAE